MRLVLGAAGALVVVASIGVAPQPAVARARWPVIGCEDRHYTFVNHFAWRYKPYGLCAAYGSLGTLTGIDHAHWRHWGRRRATANGMLVYGLGHEYPARITAYGRTVTHDFLGQGSYVAWYSTLRVVSRGGTSRGLYHGPFKLTLSVVPQE